MLRVTPPLLALASASPRRLELLATIGRVPAIILNPEIDERALPGELPRHCALRLAEAKAKTGAGMYPDHVVLAADTIVACGRRHLPKAESADAARYCLELLSGRAHQVATGVALIGPDGVLRTRLSLSRVRFKRLSEAEIEYYLGNGEWRGKAGGYGVQGRAGAFVQHLNGSWSGVVGLPLFETAALLGVYGL